VGTLSSRDYDEDDYRMEWLDANPPDFFADNLRQVVALCRARGVEVLLATWAWSEVKDDYATEPIYQRGFQEINAVTRTVAAELDVPLFDHAATMPADEALWSDGRHVNAAGGRVKARQFADAVAARFLAPAAR
jgi:hypothetical protein